MKARIATIGLVTAVALSIICSVLPSSAAPSVVVGIGVWNSAGRVSTLEMVGLNPQPEPPSRPVLIVYTSGAGLVRITPSCTARPEPRTFVATGRGSNGLWYQVSIRDVGLLSVPGTDRASDVVGVVSSFFPPNPCEPPGSVSVIAAGDFIVR